MQTVYTKQCFPKALLRKYQRMTPFKVAAIQMISRSHIEQNLAKAERLIVEAASCGAKLVVLPECFALMDVDNQMLEGKLEASDERPIRTFAATMAKKYDLYLVAGTIPVSDQTRDARPYAASILFNNLGQEVARYNKIHLFDVSVNDALGGYKESETYCSGDKAVCVETSFGRLGMTVCYDLRFPELFRLLFQQKADIIVVPSAFTQVTGAAHWMPLLQARAIENQAYIIAANQGGKHSPARETYGHSAIISPWGEVMDLMAQGEGIVSVALDFDDLRTIRKEMPISEHQRFYVDPSNSRENQL